VSAYDHATVIRTVRRARRGDGSAVGTLADELAEELARELFAGLPDVDRTVISRVVACLAFHLTQIPPRVSLNTALDVALRAAEQLDAGTTP
jgi:hypothetical protein